MRSEGSTSSQHQRRLRIEHALNLELAVDEYIRKLKGKDWIPSSIAFDPGECEDDGDGSVVSEVTMKMKASIAEMMKRTDNNLKDSSLQRAVFVGVDND